MLTGIGLFVAGFTVVFVALGAAASGIGRVLDSHQVPLAHVSGLVVIVLGLLLVIGCTAGGPGGPAWAPGPRACSPGSPASGASTCAPRRSAYGQPR